MSLRALAPLLLACALLSLPPAARAACNESSFSISLVGTQCFGLVEVPGVASEAACAAACCASLGCQLYEFCPPGATCDGYAGPSCWAGAASLPCPASSAGWLGRSRPSPLPPPPLPAQQFLPIEPSAAVAARPRRAARLAGFGGWCAAARDCRAGRRL